MPAWVEINHVVSDDDAVTIRIVSCVDVEDHEDVYAEVYLVRIEAHMLDLEHGHIWHRAGASSGQGGLVYGYEASLPERERVIVEHRRTWAGSTGGDIKIDRRGEEGLVYIRAQVMRRADRQKDANVPMINDGRDDPWVKQWELPHPFRWDTVPTPDGSGREWTVLPADEPWPPDVLRLVKLRDVVDPPPQGSR